MRKESRSQNVIQTQYNIFNTVLLNASLVTGCNIPKSYNYDFVAWLKILYRNMLNFCLNLEYLVKQG